MAVSRALLQAAQKFMSDHSVGEVVIYTQYYGNWDNLSRDEIDKQGFCTQHAAIVNDNLDRLITFKFLK